MRNCLNYAFSLMLLPALYGCNTESGNSSPAKGESKISQSNIIDGAYIPNKPNTSFNVFVKMATGICSGSIISKTFVLTAAHCLSGEKKEDVVVAAGSDVVTYPTVKTTLPKVKEIYVHPEYDEKTNDIALIELESPISADIKPVAIFNGTIPESGFFAVEAYGYSPYIWSNTRDLLGLIRGEIPVQYDGNIDGLGTRRLHGKVLSAGVIPGSKSITLFQLNGGICSGDSGGPVVVDIAGSKVQVGVNTSVAGLTEETNCTAYAFVTPVANYIPWIQEKMKATKADLVQKKFASPELISKITTEDKACAYVESAVYVMLSKDGEKVAKKECAPELLSFLERASVEARTYCVTDLGRSYPRTLHMTIEALKQDCK